MQHEVQYFADDIIQGWRREMDGSLTINPALYSVQVEDVFRHPTLYDTFRKQPALRLLRLKYRFVRGWLDLNRNDTIAKAIKALDDIDAAVDLEREDAELRARVYQLYGL